MPDNDKKDDKVAVGEVDPAEVMVRNAAPLPAALEGKLVLSSWAQSLVNHVPYAEPDPDYLSRMLLVQTLTAETPDAVFEQAGLRKLQEAIPNVPGGSTGPVEIYGLYVTGSDFGEGAPCYMILDTRDLETASEVKYTTGATQLQAQILRLVSFGVWPIRCKITRTERKDRGGRFLFWLFPPD